MTESESVALPLGDAPLTSAIIPQPKAFVKSFLKIFSHIFFFLPMLLCPRAIFLSIFLILRQNTIENATKVWYNTYVSARGTAG